MEPEEIARYSKIVYSVNDKYRFGYSHRNVSPFLTLIEGKISKIMGLVIGRPDFISIHPIDEDTDFDSISGIYVNGGKQLHLYQEAKFLRKYAHDLERNLLSEGDHVLEDLETLAQIEKELFNRGLKMFIKKNRLGNVIALRY